MPVIRVKALRMCSQPALQSVTVPGTMESISQEVSISPCNNPCSLNSEGQTVQILSKVHEAGEAV